MDFIDENSSEGPNIAAKRCGLAIVNKSAIFVPADFSVD